jgi:hypothetical protein
MGQTARKTRQILAKPGIAAAAACRFCVGTFNDVLNTIK